MERLAIIKKFLVFAVWIFSIYSLGAIFYVATYQIPFPFPIEWIEGPMMDHVIRILEGKSIYTAPSIDFVPSPYTPFYFYICAALCKLFGTSIGIMRAVSAISTVSILITLFLWAKKETLSNTAGILACGLFASTYILCAEWFFLARNDMLSLAFFMWAAYIVRFFSGKRILCFAGMLMFLSVMTKQNALVLAFGLFIAGLFIHRKNILFAALSFLPLTVFSAMAINELTHGWFFYLTYKMPAHHGIIRSRLTSFFTEDILLYMLPLLLITLAFVTSVFFTMKKKEALFYFFLTGAVFCTVYPGRIKVGGATNTFIPFFIIGALYAAVLFKNTFSRNKLLIFVVIAIAVQAALGAYNPLIYKPSEKIKKYSQDLVEFIKKTNDDVLLLPAGYIPYFAGKSPSAHSCLITDMLSNKEKKKEFSKMILDSFEKRKYPTVLVNANLIPEPLKKSIAKNYIKTPKQLGVVLWMNRLGGRIESVNVFKLKEEK